MKIGRSSNPALSENIFRNAASFAGTGSMTVAGAANKVGILLLITMLTAAYSWASFTPAEGFPVMAIAGGIGAFIVAIITIFKHEWSPYTAPLYAALEGLFLGAISAAYAMMFDGIVVKAILLTFSILFVMLFSYRSGAIQATEKFKRGVIAATGGVFVFYMATWIFSMFGVNVPYLHEGGFISIIISLVIIVIASLNLILDFDFIDKGAANGLPKHYEWYGAFGLMVTLVWLYLELLRLLSYLSGRD